jgi:hypothetical protein
MAGGERKRREEGRFADKKRPKRPAAELRELQQELVLKKEGVYKLTAESGSDFFLYCPKDGHRLSEKSLQCGQCSAKWSGIVLALNHKNHHIHMIDDKEFLKWWEKCIFRRLSFSEHNGVSWNSEPPVPFKAFHSIFESDFAEAQYKTATVRTHIRLLETCSVVENLCAFYSIDNRGSSLCKLFSSDELVMVVPPVRAVHTDSQLGGSRVNITFGWISMSIRGVINKANEMAEPAKGWSYVEARFKDEAFSMLENGRVEHSEVMLLAQYFGDKEAMLADKRRR